MNRHSKTALMLLSVIIPWSQAWSQAVIFPQEEQPGKSVASTDGQSYTLSNDLLSAHFTKNASGNLMFDGSPELGLIPGTELFYVTLKDGKPISASQMECSGIKVIPLTGDTAAVKGSERFDGNAIEANYSLGDLDIVWRAVLRDGSHYLRTEMDITAGDSDVDMFNIIPMSYTVSTPDSSFLPVTVGNTRGAILASDKIFAGLESPMGINTSFTDTIHPLTASSRTPIQGLWSRNTVLPAHKTWHTGSVVGLMAPDQQRRSVAAYVERERAVPWRPFPIYNSWYELNIDRNNAAPPAYDGNMTIDQCVDVVQHWKSKLFDKHNTSIQAFVWDDGWDSYGTWTFNPNFPNGFKEVDQVAHNIGTGIGGWLGPVGGYGASGNYRRKYWTDRGQKMRFSNPDYYKVFLDAVSNLTSDYDFRFFKLDGISAQYSSVGPDPGTEGEENAEGIIDIESRIRQIKPDIYINTTVGTWASPFWFGLTDAVWRQESDWATIGDQGSDRERWITYRDRLVHQNFIENSPLCPINNLMTHGVILTDRGDVSKDMDYEGILRELRAAFACGSGMVELYCDYALLDSIVGRGKAGQLWDDIAECIKWQEANADVLPDIHWVGGNPWNGSSSEVYGWAAWNGPKATLALRNGQAGKQDYTFTLRDALEIPAFLSGSVVLSPSFEVQETLTGLPVGTPVDIDTPLTATFPASSIFVFDGKFTRN